MKRPLVLLLLLLSLLTACYSPQMRIVIATTEQSAADSLEGSLIRPYGVGYNFIVHADSLLIVEDRPMHWSEGVAESSDTLWLYQHDPLVVAAAIVIPEDSIDSVWVKVARDQLTMGWIHENELLASVVPDDPISQFIHYFSTRQAMGVMLAVVLLGWGVLALLHRRRRVPCVWLHDLPSVYPTSFVVALAFATQLYTFIQRIDPQTWVHFYYYPTLTPYPQPLWLGLYLASLWLLLVLALTVVERIIRHLRLLDAVLYSFSFFVVCATVHLSFLLLGSYPWVGWVVFLFFVVWAYRRSRQTSQARYVCGQCGASLHHLGRCAHCGAIND